MYYWKDIDTIAPRRPVRARRNHPAPRQRSEEPAPQNKQEVIEEKIEATTVDEPDWQEIAHRLQADMENFKKRQKRRADEAIAGERTRLLSLFLPVVDNLTRALAHQDGESEEAVRQGVELISRELMRILEAEGVTQLNATGQTFDPSWQEALATAPSQEESGTVVEQIEAAYKLGDVLLRPAKVVVAA